MRTSLPALALSLLLGVSAVAGAASAQESPPIAARQRTGPGILVAPPVVSAFELVDHTGRPVTERSWPGKHLLIFFGFGQCPDLCPTALDRFAAVMELLGPDAARVQPLFVTIDPERDTQDFLARHVANFDPRLVGLTGLSEQVLQASANYRVMYARSDEGEERPYTMVHTLFEYVIRPDGTAAYAFTPSADPQRVVELIQAELRRR